MSTPLPFRGRLARDSASQGTPLLKSPSTPLDVYRLQQRHAGRQSVGLSPATPANTSGSVFLDSQSPNTFAAYRRNAGFGSPGVAAARASPRTNQADQGGAQHGNGTTGLTRTRSTRFVRRKSWKQRIQEAPGLWYDQVMFSEYLDFGNPAIGYPLGAVLHILSVLVQMMHPDGALRFRTGSGGRSRGSSLFADQGGLSSRRRHQQDAAWRWSANFLMLLIVLAVLSNAYHLFVSRRRYHLWLKPTNETLESENAKLVDLPNELGASQKKVWLEIALETSGQVVHSLTQGLLWCAKKILYRVRVIRYFGAVVRFFFPPSSGRSSGQRRSSSSGPQMHALDVWQAPEVPLRIFTLYSPLHLLVYLYNIRKLTAGASGSSRFYALLVGCVLMALISAQTAALAFLYAGLVKDKALIAGEVLNEYNQKFVMPRAMPVCRDASTMTTQSEMLGPDDLRPMHEGVDASSKTKASSTPRRPKKSRSTATG